MHIRHLIVKTKMNTMSGGCHGIEYSNGGLKKKNLALQELYPEWFIEYEKEDRSRIKPSRIWRTFKQELKSES